MSPPEKRPTPRFEVGDRVEIVDTTHVYRVDGIAVGSPWRFDLARGRVEWFESLMKKGSQGRVEILLDEVVETDADVDVGAPREGVSRVLVRPFYLRHVDVVESLGELDAGPA